MRGGRDRGGPYARDDDYGGRNGSYGSPRDYPSQYGDRYGDYDRRGGYDYERRPVYDDRRYEDDRSRYGAPANGYGMHFNNTILEVLAFCGKKFAWHCFTIPLACI